MGILDVLRRLGILRTGSTTWSGDIKNRPVYIEDMPAQESQTADERIPDDGEDHKVQD